MKKSLKITMFVLLALVILIFSAAAAFLIVTADAKLDDKKLINYSRAITFYDDDGRKIESSSLEGKRSAVLIDDLNEETKNAFIASEDRKFYSHNGLDYGRMLKALARNAASFSFREGASTISQQLIKNTHLSSDKTLTRKLREIRLTKQLERAYTKDEILEMYLNTIYFGHSCYGLQSAAAFYFAKDAEDLNLEESAALAGLLSSPNNYSPFKNAEKCLARRNLVLRCMLECNFIDRETYEKSIKKPLGQVKTPPSDSWGDYIDEAIDELEGLNLDCYADLSGCRVFTYMDRKAQCALERTESPSDAAMMISDGQNGVCAYKSTSGMPLRQPGSTIKPLLVYAPAVEEGIIYPFTKIRDEKIDFGGYSPQNHDNKYHSDVTVAESIAKSHNIPAVKTLNALGFENAEKYARKMGIALQQDDMALSLALGGMKYGTTIKQLCDAYTVFRAGGEYSPSRFIKKIEDAHGRTIYTAKHTLTKVFSEGTCSLMNEMLIGTAKTGTAKKLKNLPYDIAAKTGTCGNSSGNTDAYALAYTSEHTFAIWLGSAENKRTDVTGGGQCCKILKALLEELDLNPPPLDIKSGTEQIYIDREDYEKNGKIIRADDISPKLNKMAVRCSVKNIPTQKSTKFSRPTIEKPQIYIKNNEISIVLCETLYYSYLIKCDDKIVYDGPFCKKITDTPEKGSHTYTVTPYYKYQDKIYSGDTICLDKICIDAQSASPPPPIAFKDWCS